MSQLPYSSTGPTTLAIGGTFYGVTQSRWNLDHIPLSGELYRGSFLSIQSGAHSSGYVNWERFQTYHCSSCGCPSSGSLDFGGPTVTITGGYGLWARYCSRCAGYDQKRGGFGWQREEWIRDTLHFDKSTPAYVIADYLEEMGRTKDSEYMRTR